MSIFRPGPTQGDADRLKGQYLAPYDRGLLSSQTVYEDIEDAVKRLEQVAHKDWPTEVGKIFTELDLERVAESIGLLFKEVGPDGKEIKFNALEAWAKSRAFYKVHGLDKFEESLDFELKLSEKVREQIREAMRAGLTFGFFFPGYNHRMKSSAVKALGSSNSGHSSELGAYAHSPYMSDEHGKILNFEGFLSNDESNPYLLMYSDKSKSITNVSNAGVNVGGRPYSTVFFNLLEYMVLQRHEYEEKGDHRFDQDGVLIEEGSVSPRPILSHNNPLNIIPDMMRKDKELWHTSYFCARWSGDSKALFISRVLLRSSQDKNPDDPSDSNYNPFKLRELLYEVRYRPAKRIKLN